MRHSYRLPVALFVLLTMLLFHLGLKSGTKPARTDSANPPSDSSRRSGNLGHSQANEVLYRLRDVNSVRTAEGADTLPSDLKTEGIFILRVDPDQPVPAAREVDALLLLDLNAGRSAYPVEPSRPRTEATESIRF
ncbi:hypothetical protein [Marinimicrobium locisalis]|uniref:hypothetical protein n=1 Tax=Marinimicrobium locisalis TaxID=546022 RepID=UPI003221AAAB